MRGGLAGGDGGFGAYAVKMHIEKTVSVEMREFAAIPGEADAAETMAAQPDAWQLKRERFECLHCGELPPIEQGGAGKEKGIEDVWGERDARHPVHSANDESKDHKEA